MTLNKKKENFMITALTLVCSVIMAFIMGIGMTLAFASVTLFRIIKNGFRLQPRNTKPDCKLSFKNRDTIFKP